MNALSSVVKVFPRSIDLRLPFGFVFRIALLSRHGKWYDNWPMLYVQRYPWNG